MSCWLAIPSKRPPEEAEKCLREWRERGYKISLWRDASDAPVKCDRQFSAMQYPGYASAVNQMCGQLMIEDSLAAFFVCAGDDTLPDPNKTALEIEIECRGHFYTAVASTREERMAAETFGVMQPTGHRWGEGQGGFTNAPIDRVAGSPWIGREFARRMYGGTGPYWHEYRHQFVDEELQNVAIKYGVFWQRPDLTHFHNHWALPREGERMAPSDRMPAFLAEANSAAHWAKYKAIFAARQAAGFPGSEPIG